MKPQNKRRETGEGCQLMCQCLRFQSLQEDTVDTAQTGLVSMERGQVKAVRLWSPCASDIDDGDPNERSCFRRMMKNVFLLFVLGLCLCESS